MGDPRSCNRECIEYLRYLHDHRLTRFALLLVGGDGAWQVLAREPMLRSRIYRRVVFREAELVLFIDDHFAHGNLRDWAAFTATAAQLCRAGGHDRVDESIVRNAFALHGGTRSTRDASR